MTSRVLAVSLFALGTALGSASTALAQTPPPYSEDPFGDADFADAPLILDVAHPTKGRGEIGVLFNSTLIDKYTSHIGGTIDFQYHFGQTFGIGLGFSYLNGSLTSIVTEGEGIMGNLLADCERNGTTNCNLTPTVPDYDQITSSIDAVLLWSPLYGKINVVSELDVNLQVYGLIGPGVHGSRITTATRDPADERGFSLTNEGGAFTNMTPHMNLGLGLKVFVMDWLALRGEVKSIIWRDEFDFDRDTQLDGYFSSRYMSEVGLTFVAF
jgi:outer membrane beta-barrel protein